MAGLLVCSNFGPPLRADEGPLVITASGEQRSAPTASGDHSPGVRFHESDSDSTVSRSRKSSLKLGNQPSVPERDGETQITGPTSGSSGFRFADGEGPRQVAPSGHNLAGTSPDTSKSTAPQFRFDDQRRPLLRQRRGAALLTLTLSGETTSSEAGGAAAPARGFAFTDRVEPLVVSDEAGSVIEPTLARDVLMIGTPATAQAPQNAAPLPQIHITEAPAEHIGGVLMTIRQRSTETSPSHVRPARAESPIDAAPEALSSQATSPAAMPPVKSVSGVVNVSAFEPDAHLAPVPVRTAEGHRPATSREIHAVSAEAAPVLQRLAQVDAADNVGADLNDASPAVWSQDQEASPAARQVEPVEQVPGDWNVPPSPEAPADQAWWTAAQDHTFEQHTALVDRSENESFAASAASELPACLELAAAHLLLPISVTSFEVAHHDRSAHATPGAAASPQAPALLHARAEVLLQAPSERVTDTPYSGATKPAGAAALPQSEEPYTMGPARASHPVPEGQPAFPAARSGSPLEGGAPAGSFTGPATEVAALLDELAPPVPAAPRLSVGSPATSPTAADFPSSDPEPAETPAADPAAGGVNAAEQTLGEAPEETNEPLQFLRRQTVLLEPGEHQFDVGISYLNDTSDFPTLLSDGQNLAVVRAEARQRLLSVPLELRVGVAPYTQAFVNVPFGWSNSEVSFNGSEFTEDEGGIGDVSAGVTKQIVMGNEYYPDVLASLAFSAPTGDSSITTALGTPGSSLGQGFWTLTGSLSFIQTYDPLVFFYGLGYTFRFQNEFGDNIEVEPGDQVFYRFGAGFAVNPHVTLSAAFTGSVLGRDKVDGNEIGGSVREPMSLRLAATISRRKGSRTHSSFKLVEPYVNFGLNEDSIDSLIGISWTH